MINHILSILGGVLLGIITGIIPGIHPNTIASLSFIGLGVNNIYISIILFSCLIVSNIFEFVSACYLGLPEEGESLATYPLHELLMNKKSLAGMRIVGYTSIITVSILAGIGLLLKESIALIYNSIKSYAWIFLLIMSLHLLIKEKKKKTALIIFLTSGVLGIINFNIGLSDPFLPMLTGLFGISSLITGIKNEISIPEQMKQVVVRINFWEMLKTTFLGIISSIIMALIPAVTPSQVGLIMEEFKNKKTSIEKKITGITSINISDTILSLIALISINKARSGVVEKISTIISVTNKEYHILLFSGVASCIIGVLILEKTAIFISKNIHKIDYEKLSKGVIIFITLLVSYITGVKGIIILLLSTGIGYYCIKKDVRRSQLLGCLVIPTILFYL